MTVSVIVPVYQAQVYLASCLDSILAQTFSDFEIICVNDGSFDKSPAILSDYAKRDKRIRIINQENKGVSAARNLALQYARGEFITFLDSDDMWHPCYLEQMVKALKETNADFVSCRYHTVPSEQKRPYNTILKAEKVRVSKTPFDDLISRQNGFTVMVWGKIFRRHAISSFFFDEGINCGEDYIFIHQVAYAAKTVAILDEDLVCYRIGHPSIMRSSFSDKKIQDHLRMAFVLQDYFQSRPMKWDTKRKLSRQIAKIFLKYAMSYPVHNIDNYRPYWSFYAKQLKEYYQKGVYCPNCLSVKNRFLSWLFLHEKFSLLQLIEGI